MKIGDIMFAAEYSASEGQFFNAEETECNTISPNILPAYMPPNPWPSSNNFDEDFIMVSEFSEIEGPKPLLVIPSNGGGDFNKEQFAVNIMSVDYNSTNSSRAATGAFTISEDTSLLQENLTECAHAYVHHFTVYDIYARGFVRPFCLAYITTEKSKLVQHLCMIMRKFSKITEALKYGNCKCFIEDLRRKLQDLAFTKENHVAKSQFPAASHSKARFTNFEENHQGSSSRTKNILSELEQAILETSQILSQFESMKINQRLEKRFKKMEEAATHRQQVHSQSASLHGDGYYSDCEDKQKNFKMRKSKSNEVLDSGRDARYQPKLIKIDGYRTFDVSLRSLHELCTWGTKIGLIRLKRFYKYFSRKYEAIAIEKTESRIVHPLSSLLTIGRTVAVNFIPETNVQCCKTFFQVCHNVNSCRTCNLSDDKTSILTCSSINTVPLIADDDDDAFGVAPSSYEAKFMSGSAFGSMESLYFDATDNPCSEDELDSSSESSSDVRESDVWVDMQLQMLVNTDSSSLEENSVSSSPHQDSGSCCADKLSSSLGSGSPGQLGEDAFQDSDAIEKNNCEQLCTCSEDSGSLEVDSGPVQAEISTDKHRYTIQVGKSSSSAACLERLGHVLSDTSNTMTTRVIPIGSFASWLCSNSSRFPRLLRVFLNRYTFAVHLIYALLSGRMVIIAGNHKYQREIKSLIATLCLFVPGHCSKHHMVIPWYTKPITIADVGKMKLVGLAKVSTLHRMVPSVVQSYVSILDIDKQEFRSPPYQGTYLHTVVNQCKLFRSDTSYIASVQSILLEMVSKSFLFYHSYCLADQDAKNCNAELPSSSDEKKKTIAMFLSKLGIMDGDADIIEYWTELVKHQQVSEMNSFSRSSRSSQPIRLDYRICSTFYA